MYNISKKKKKKQKNGVRKDELVEKFNSKKYISMD